MSDQLATDIRALVDDGAPPITLAEVQLAAVDATPLRPRRRWPVLAAAAVVVILITAGVLFAVTRHDAPNVRTPAGSPPAPAPAPTTAAPTPLGAPEVQGPDAASTLLTSYAQIHVGYAYIYADGRVIWLSDPGGFGTGGGTRTRRLNATGLDLVRSGKLSPPKLADAFAPPTSDCFILTLEQARAVHDLNGPIGSEPDTDQDQLQMIPPDAGSDQGAIDLMVMAVLPHSGLIMWGA